MKKKPSKGKKLVVQKMQKPKRNQHHLMHEAERIMVGEDSRQARKAQEFWKMLKSQEEKAQKKKQRLEKKRQKEDLKETMNEVKKAIDKKEEEEQQEGLTIRPMLNLEVEISMNKPASESEEVASPLKNKPNYPQIIEISDDDDEEQEVKASEEQAQDLAKDEDKLSTSSTEFINQPNCFAFLYDSSVLQNETKPVKRIKADFVTACSSSQIEEMNEQAIDENIDIEGVRKVQARIDAYINSLPTEEEKLKVIMQQEVMRREDQSRSHESRSNLLGLRKHSAIKVASSDLDIPSKSSRRNN